MPVIVSTLNVPPVKYTQAIASSADTGIDERHAQRQAHAPQEQEQDQDREQPPPQRRIRAAARASSR